MLSAPCWINAT